MVSNIPAHVHRGGGAGVTEHTEEMSQGPECSMQDGPAFLTPMSIFEAEGAYLAGGTTSYLEA